MKNLAQNNIKNSTIAAICSGTGGALSIIRISGPDALNILCKVWHGKQMPSKKSPRIMHLGKVADGETCLAVYMPGPASYTGEDVAELHCHGGNYAPARLLRAVLDAGAVPAPGGEFTKRAFLNGKLDLTQAEAVMDLIGATNERACRIAERQMSGCLGQQIRGIRENMIRILAETESRLDFPDEDLDWVPPADLCADLQKNSDKINELLRTAREGAVIRNGVSLVIAGKTNVGKSSLMNRMLGFDRAIVSNIPGTTRDTLEESAVIHGVAYKITDTAGLRKESSDPLEKIGMERSREMLKTARIVLWLCDAESGDIPAAEDLNSIPSDIPVIFCWNKIDACQTPEKLPQLPGTRPALQVSVKTGDGLKELFDTLNREVWQNGDHGCGDIAVSERHASLLENANRSVLQAIEELSIPDWELAASMLNNAVRDLGSVTGETVKPDILDEIFARFCIGK